MGDLDKDLCGFWKRVASSNVVLPTSAIIAYEFLEGQLDVHIDMLLGKDRMAELRAIAKSHKLAAGSQTIPNSLAEAAASRGQSPPAGPPAAAVFPAPQRKKLPLKKAKRKAPRVVSNEEADESTEDGLICKRKRVAVTEPPAIESAAPNFIENPPSASTPFESARDVPVSNASVAEAAPEQLANTQASNQAAEELPASPPRLEAPPAIQPCEGGGEHQPPPPPATSSLPTALQEALKSFTVRLSGMVDDCLPQIVGEGLKDSLEKFELDNRVNREVASTAKAAAEKTKCDMLMQGLEFSRVENALKDDKELRKKLHDKLQDTVELESKIVPLREKIAALEEELSETAAELARVREENSGLKKKADELELEVTQVREENSGLKTKTDELHLEAAQVLTSDFGAALEQFACRYPDLDLSEFSVYNELVDGKIVPPIDLSP
ncbi:dynactin, 150 kDa isoform-like [Phaseolus vulgaris]|uniref:dynactin, 150 kDa isoform-like n=1 Tax=Phaseolus vulgaris TaxID=3885 RepID=UPI0035CBD0EB